MKKIGRDKWKHFYVGIALGMLLYFPAILYWPLQPQTAFVVTVVILIVICYGFELFSLVSKRGHYELLDAVAGVIGGLAGMGITYLLKSVM